MGHGTYKMGLFPFRLPFEATPESFPLKIDTPQEEVFDFADLQATLQRRDPDRWFRKE